MSTFGGEYLTLSDMRKRLDPNGSTAFIVEALEQSNPIIKDILWMEGNLKTGNQTTVRTSIPRPKTRLINRGVKPGKSTTKQVQDSCIILEDRSKVDIELIALQSDKMKFRASEDAAFMQGATNTVADTMFYGDTASDPEVFDGFSARYSTYGGAVGTSGHQVLSAGTAGEKCNTSCFFIGWGKKSTVGIYPQYTMAGLKMSDLGQRTVLDSDSGEYEALVTLFNWKCGLAVQNIRHNALLRNIDTSKLDAMTSAQKLDLMNALTKTKNRIQNLTNGDKQVKLYVSESMYNFIECYLNDKNNVFVTQQSLMNAAPVLYFKGIPVEQCDSVADTESACLATV